MYGFERIRNTFRQNPRKPGGERRAPLRVAMLTAGLLAVILLISACGKVPMPASDETPPDLTWHVMDGMNGSLIPTIGGLTDGERTGSAPDLVAVTLMADDSEGVKHIKLSEPLMTYTCASDRGGRTRVVEPDPDSAAAYQQAMPAPDSEGRVYDHLMLVDTTYFTFDCGEGQKLISATATITGEAENFFGGLQASTLVLTHTP